MAKFSNKKLKPSTKDLLSEDIFDEKSSNKSILLRILLKQTAMQTDITWLKTGFSNHLAHHFRLVIASVVAVLGLIAAIIIKCLIG